MRRGWTKSSTSATPTAVMVCEGVSVGHRCLSVSDTASVTCWLELTGSADLLLTCVTIAQVILMPTAIDRCELVLVRGSLQV